MYVQPLDQLRLQRGAEHLHSLPPRALAEFLAELAGRVGGMPATFALLTEYERLTVAKLRAAGGDRFPPRPLHSVQP